MELCKNIRVFVLDHSTCGGVILCYKEILSFVLMDAVVSDSIEILIFKVLDTSGHVTLCCSCYRPPSQAALLLEYLTSSIDHLMIEKECHHTIIVGNPNQHMVQASFDSFLAVFDLTNHVSFPTYCTGTLDPVITDLPENTVACSPLTLLVVRLC